MVPNQWIPSQCNRCETTSYVLSGIAYAIQTLILLFFYTQMEACKYTPFASCFLKRLYQFKLPLAVYENVCFLPKHGYYRLIEIFIGVMLNL